MKILITILFVFSFTIVQCQTKVKAAAYNAKAISIFLKDKTRVGQILPGTTVKTRLVLIKCTRSKNSNGMYFTNFLFAHPEHFANAKIEISLTFDKAVDNCYSTISEVYKNLFQQLGNDKKEFLLTADSLSKNSVIRITVQSETPVYTNINGIQGKLTGYIIHEHDHHDHKH